MKVPLGIQTRMGLQDLIGVRMQQLESIFQLNLDIILILVKNIEQGIIGLV